MTSLTFEQLTYDDLNAFKKLLKEVLHKALSLSSRAASGIPEVTVSYMSIDKLLWKIRS